jgi:phage terminase large subunit
MWFRPKPKQEHFIRSAAREVAYVGGFASGKTVAGAVKALLVSLSHPGTVGLVGRQSYQALEQTTKRVILDGDDKPPIIPPSLVRRRIDDPVHNKVILNNGSEILFRAFQDWNPEKLRSLNLGWLYLDEASEASERLWNELNGRLRHPAGPGQAWLTTNPNGHDWVWRRFHPDAEHAAGDLFVSKTDDMADVLPSGYIQHLRDTMPLEWQRRFLDASFDTASGLVWPEWDRVFHVIDPFELEHQWKRFESLDHGRRNPTAVLWWAVDFDGSLFVVDGYYEPGLPSQHAAAIKATRRGREMPPIVAGGDVFNRGPTGESAADVYAEHGIQLRRANDDFDGGVLRVGEWLLRRDAPRVFVFDTPGTLPFRQEIADYRWKDLSPAQEEKLDQPEAPRKIRDHAVDAFRYGIMSRPRPTVVPEPRDRDADRPKTLAAGLLARDL